jgi:hypothetical protein
MFKTTNFKESSGSLSKIIEPGEKVCIIRNISLESPPYDRNAYYVQLLLEAPVDISQHPEFVGIAVSKTDPSQGNYKGQIGYVNNGRYPFSTYTYQGKTIDRDSQIFRWVTSLANRLGVLEQMNKDNVEADTIEEYVKIVANYLRDRVAKFTIGGSEYFTEGYSKPNYRLFLPKFEKDKYPFESMAHSEPAKFIFFDASKHIVVKERSTATSEVKEQSLEDLLLKSHGTVTSSTSSSMSLPSDLFNLPETTNETEPF